MPFQLTDVVASGDVWKPQRILIAGVQGVGKTTFAATFEDAILIQIEDGAGAIDCATFPDRIEYMEHFEEAIETLLNGEHNFKTAILDTADWLERVVWEYVIRCEPVSEKGVEVKDIEGYGFGKGYGKAEKWFAYILGRLQQLRDVRGMNIVILAHVEAKRHDPPDSDPYDRYQIKLHKRAAALIQEWADMHLFLKFRTSIVKSDVGFGKEISRGKGTGERVIYTEERPAWSAKNRWSLSPEIYIGTDKTWAAFHNALYDATAGRYPLPGPLARENSAIEPPPEVESDATSTTLNEVPGVSRYSGGNSRPPEGVGLGGQPLEPGKF